MKNNTYQSNNILAFAKQKLPRQDERFIDHLNQAIRNNKLCLHYQPRYNVATGKADILEALVRWPRPDAGLFYPECFLPAAKENGLIFLLDLWVFEQCCKDLIWVQTHVNPNTKIAINLSMQAGESIYLAQKLIEISERCHTPLSEFEFELTADQYFHDIRKVAAFCEILKNHGATFSLDSFGTGQSSLTNICELPANSIKIDRCFARDIGHSKRSELIIGALVNLARDSGLLAVVQGIETPEQYHFLDDIGCDQQQGFLLCRPTPLSRITPATLYESAIR